MATGPSLDTFISAADRALRALLAPPAASRPLPLPAQTAARDAQNAENKADHRADLPPAVRLTEDQKRESAALMRVNHAGEVAAQALYHAQALLARDPDVREFMLRAAREETDHLAWCETRLKELGARPSVLNPLWYAGSFSIGALAALLGDRASLGFVAETERQVEGHLKGHLDQLPREDLRSRAIVEAMCHDEAGHGREASNAGGIPLPGPVRELMRRTARVMTHTSYRF